MYGLDIRKMALKVYSNLQSLRKTSLLLNIHFSTISRWFHHLDRKSYPVRSSKTFLISETIKDIIQTNPFISHRDLTIRINSCFCINISRELVRIAIKKLGFTKKNARFVCHPKTLELDVQRFLHLRNLSRHKQFFSIDETSFGRAGFQKKGYALKGHKLFVNKKRPRMTSMSVCACASNSKWIGFSKKEGSYDTQSFLCFLKTLNLPYDCVLLLDNVRFHHSKLVKEYCDSNHINLLFIPPYSPWFNPIEGCFSIVKKAFPEAQNIDDAFKALKQSHFKAFFDKCLEATERW